MAKSVETRKASKTKKTLPEKDTKIVYVSTVTQYLQEIHYLTSKHKDAKFIYRGQKDSRDPVNCGMTRRYINSGHVGEITKQDLLEYHNDYLLENAKKIGLNFKDGRELKDMELIADLQHHGCATMLIDFTRDPLIALFFATEQSSRDKDTDGAVYVLRINDTQRFKELRNDDVCKPDCIKNILSENDQKFLHFWQPTQLNKRIPAQHSVFVFGEPEISSKDILLKIVIKKKNEASEKEADTLRPPKEERKKKRVQNCKVRIQEVLQNSHDLNNTVLFSDLPGFSYANSQYAKLETKTPSFLLAKARSYYQNNEYKKTIVYYTQYIKKIKNNAEVYYNRGIAKYNLGRHQEAIEDYNKAIKLDPKYTTAYYNRGIAKADLGRHVEAIEDYYKAVEINPNYARAYVELGNSKDYLGNHQEALEDYTKAIRLDPKSASAYYNRGITYTNLGNDKNAIRDYEKVIDLDPNYVGAFNNLGNIKKDLGYLLDAIKCYEKAIQLDPKNAVPYINLGSTKDALGYSREAINDYNKAIELDPKDAKAYYNRGVAKGKLGHHQEAIYDYDKAIELDPKDAMAYYNRGITKVRLGCFDEALLNLQIAWKLATEQNNTFILVKLTNIYNENGSLKDNWKETFKKLSGNSF
jgi:tetratricopeptide (TPR) repeat protein